jgi:hypothetical protein
VFVEFADGDHVIADRKMNPLTEPCCREIVCCAPRERW